MTRHYQRLVFITTPVPEATRREQESRSIARDKGWKFERLEGDLGWLERMLQGRWEESEFLVLQPGQRVGLRHDGRLIGADGP
jgi:hypothetical protein